MARIVSHLKNNVVAWAALFIALGGTGYAAVSLPAGSVGSKQLRNGAVTPAKLDGKNISGSGMDTNVIGRKFVGNPDAGRDDVSCTRIFIRGLTEETHGNACGEARSGKTWSIVVVRDELVRFRAVAGKSNYDRILSSGAQSTSRWNSASMRSRVASMERFA